MTGAAVFAIVVVTGCGRIGFDATDGASCVELASTCGATQTDSCCESLPVPGGTYARSYDVAADGMYADMTYLATVSDFSLDKYEVTVGRFRRFVMAGQGTAANPPSAGAGAHPDIAASGWDPSWDVNLAPDTAALVAAIDTGTPFETWTDTPGDNETRPMDAITWFEAMAFCAWDGGFLPTEAEWNYAATGGDEQRAYPWSSPPGSLVNDDATYASYNCQADGTDTCDVTDLIVVGTKPAGDGRWGQSDLGGNVWEWTVDWYTTPYPQVPCPDCANLAPATMRVLRGAGYNSVTDALRTGVRNFADMSTRTGNVGVRCARAP